MRPLLPLAAIQERRSLIFPRQAFDPVASNPLAGVAVAAMIYVNAVVPDIGNVPEDVNWARPSTCLWLSHEAYARSDEKSRQAWATAARRGKSAVETVLSEWALPVKQWYADNSRETLRDETFPLWLGFAALRVLAGVPTTSSKGRWALTEAFANLFDPSLTGDNLDVAIEAWRDSHMDPGTRLRISTARQREQEAHSVTVTFPNGTVRQLEPGEASLILKGVVESWAPMRLKDPVVLTISEPGSKILVADQQTLSSLGLSINASTLLPDAVVVDVGSRPVEFWIVEAVASDGPITEDRKAAILRWAQEQSIPVNNCRFLSAFLSRNDAAARRRLKDLALGTYAWYADEPRRELAWYDLP